jgi:hypothetical protein
MVETEPSGQLRRSEPLRAVETSPGVKVYRAGSIANRLVTEGTKRDAKSASVPMTKSGNGDVES